MNLWPLACKTSALPTELPAHLFPFFYASDIITSLFFFVYNNISTVFRNFANLSVTKKHYPLTIFWLLNTGSWLLFFLTRYYPRDMRYYLNFALCVFRFSLYYAITKYYLLSTIHYFKTEYLLLILRYLHLLVHQEYSLLSLLDLLLQ